ncbi:MAG: hypothetical protein AABX16_01730 [Nanoarchaeota archaeon]
MRLFKTLYSSRFLDEVLDPSDYIVLSCDGKAKEETTQPYSSDDTKTLQ